MNIEKLQLKLDLQEAQDNVAKLLNALRQRRRWAAEAAESHASEEAHRTKAEDTPA